MRLLLTFWKLMLVWTAVIAAILLGITVLTGSGEGLLTTAPVWVGIAFALAAYPAGIATADEVIPGPELEVSRLAGFAAVALSASLGAFALANWLGPALLPPPVPGALPDPASMTLGEMREGLRVLGERALDGPATAENWLPFNHLAYYFVRRTDGMLLPALFASVGLLTGYWSGRLARTELRLLAEWGLGAFLLISTYFAGENGYEMILTRIGGPAEFVGLLVLIVPGTLVVGLGLATVADLLSSPARNGGA